jgi:hypothetical protein
LLIIEVVEIVEEGLDMESCCCSGLVDAGGEQHIARNVNTAITTTANCIAFIASPHLVMAQLYTQNSIHIPIDLLLI